VHAARPPLGTRLIAHMRSLALHPAHGRRHSVGNLVSSPIRRATFGACFPICGAVAGDRGPQLLSGQDQAGQRQVPLLLKVWWTP
jgi:hypothetical protein